VQDRYVGDVGDFGKYGLLRVLCAEDEEAALALGVVWYLVPDEAHNNDGKHVGYLLPRAENEYERCDRELYQTLRWLVLSGQRSVASVRAYGLLPEAHAFFESPLVLPPRRREAARTFWFRQALKATEGCDLVFVDPDNGLLPPASDSLSIKHARCEELREFAGRGQSMVVYHHLSRQGSHEQQIREWQIVLAEHLGREPFALRFRRGSGRAYFVIPADAHSERLERRAAELARGPWSHHFSLVSGAVEATP
jgi:hypothetical protein